MTELEPFYVFRTALFVALTAYTIVTMAGTAWHLARVLRGSDPRRRLLRVYLSYQLLSFRLKPLRTELLQIGFWFIVLMAIWYAHV